MKLPQAYMYIDFVNWVAESLYLDHGYPMKDSFGIAVKGCADFLRENNITNYPDERFVWDRPSAMEVKHEYILRDG